MLRAADILDIPIYATTQLSSKLGPLCEELELDTETPKHKMRHLEDKSLFSMWTPTLAKQVTQGGTISQLEVAIVGIESHICVTQTALDLVRAGHKVYVLADGVSSCNAEEVPVALARLRHEGVTVTTSESWIYECMGDAGIEQFRAISALVKDTKDDAKRGVKLLCGRL